MGGSELLKTIFGVKSGKPPRLDLKEAAALVDVLQKLAEKSFLKSAHDCAEGGLAVTLAESCISEKGRETGAAVEAPLEALSKEAFLFGESQNRVVISVDPKNVNSAEAVIQSHAYPYRVIGKVGGKELSINDLVRVPVEVLSHTWRNSIRRRMDV